MSEKGLPKGAYGLKDDQKEYIPYVPSEKVMPEFTLLSVIIGIILAIVFGAANAYLGLKVGMTVSASIPAAVISMAIVRVILKRKSILENNMVQTIASAGESVAAGAIFTIPALFLLGTNPSVFTMGIISLIGGTLGVVFMIPIRKYLIVQEHGRLPYPEGTACAEVLVAGEVGGASAGLVFAGGGVGLLYKLLGDGVKLFPTEVSYGFKGALNGAGIGMDVYPALLGVGFIIGPKISAYMLGGAILGWFCYMPLIALIGGGNTIAPGTMAISKMDYWTIWGSYIKYIGAGAVAAGGIISLIKSLPAMISSFKEAMGAYKNKSKANSVKRTENDLNSKFILTIVAILIILMVVVKDIQVGWLGAILVVIFGFFFVTVSSRIVGLVGSSSNPVSGMTIATLLFTALIMKATGVTGKAGVVAAISVGAIICTAAAIAGDTSQDLKTGYLIGSTPKKQQIGELIGVLATSIVIGFIMITLNKAYGFGSKELGAPQATLMKLVVEGIMSGNLPWNLVFVGIGSAVMFELFGIPSLPVAIGLYLPIHLSTPIMVGGIIKGILDKKVNNEEELAERNERGILYSSGLIAGEGLMGVIIAGIVAARGKAIGFAEPVLGQAASIIFFVLVILLLLYQVFIKKSASNKA
ncbi:OPT family oligopeptide transporter [Haloimpatiens massiliensis]|uniref:OPT family oligopeptide transporter n=1 Tax=Haloimpatiens massiliensis TaxID=1658110 RepID=UPI000C8446CE|nr:oligopeptide transporter, OPT family [Haloimpatiens massiliensis]